MPKFCWRLSLAATSGLISLLLICQFATSLYGQATPCCNLPNNTWNPSIGSIPGQHTQPTIEQTRSFIENQPALRTLDSQFKSTIIYSGAGSGLLNGPYLPNGMQNPLYQNGIVTPNWYVRSTWPSTGMNWKGVQPDGFLPSSLATSYNPRSAITTYNPTLPNNRYTPSVSPANFSVSRPLPPTTQISRDKPAPGANLDSFHLAPRTIPQGSSLAGPSPTDIARAVENRTRALALSEAAGDKVGQVTNHAALAQLLVQQGNIEQGLVHVGIAERMADGLDDPRLQVSLLRAKAQAYMPSGGFENATELYHQAIVILKSLGEDNEQAEIQTSLGWAYQSFGDVPRAIASYEEARRLFVKGRNINGEIRVALGAGSLYQSMGEFKKAQDEYIRVAARASDEQFARMMVSVAEMLVASNRPQSALIRYEKALSLIKPAKDSVLEISILTGIGRCHMVLGSYDTAQEYFDLASAKARESGNRALEAGVIASIGELQYWIAITSSTAVHKVATTFYSASSDGPMEFFHQSLLSAGRLSPAAGTLGRPDVYVESSVKPRFSRALRTYNEALSLMHDVGDRIGEIGVLTNMGLVYDAWGKRREALSFYLPALQKMDEFQTLARLEDFRIDLANQSSRLYQRAIELEFRQHHMEEAFNLSERSRARSFLDQLGNGRIDLAKNAPTDFSQREARLRRENISLQRQLAQELAKSGPEVNPETISSLQSRLSAVQREYEESVRGLKISSPEYASFLSIAPLTLREVQRKLASDVTVLSYFTTPGITLAFVVTKNGFHVFRLPVSGAELSMAITSLLDFPGESDEPPPLRSLYSWLIEPVRSRLKTAKLVVVPHGVLNNLPFAALTPDGEEFLNDSYAISYLPSTSVLPYINASVKPVGNQVLVMANDQEEGTPQLSHAYDEAREVAALWHARLLMGADATASSLQTSAGDYSILHLIAHIYADPNHPQFSRIILAQNKESDGSLELNGILGLDLRKTSLVVLSGCRGQSGNWSRGDDVTALNRAFMYAGAPSVIASLWSVDDDATQQLMIAFYSHLKEGLSKAEALRAAQIEVRRIHRNPFYWAGFVLTGDPGESANSSLVARSAK